MKFFIRKAGERGHTQLDWLSSWHSFSFGRYYDPKHMFFGALQVLNDDVIAPMNGFGMHAHNDMEIVTVVIKGELEHEDDMETNSILKEGDIQVMSAGTGIMHAEFNHSKSDTLELFQIWIRPRELNTPPRYDEKHIDFLSWSNEWRVVVTGEQNTDSLWINQDAYLSLGSFKKGTKFTYEPKSNKNGIYFFVIHGSVQVQNQSLDPRDAMAMTDTEKIDSIALSDARVLCIEVPLEI